MMQTNLVPLLRSPLGRWLGLAILLVALLTTIGVHTLTSKKAHAANCPTTPGSVVICAWGYFATENKVMKSIYVDYALPGQFSKTICSTADPVINLPPGSFIQLLPATDINCNNLVDDTPLAGQVHQSVVLHSLPSGVDICNIYWSQLSVEPHSDCPYANF
jgi:hypothetical protein